MADADPFGDPGQRLVRSNESAGLLVEGRTKDRSLASDGALWAALAGRPRWNDSALAALAAREGDAVALIEAYRRDGERFLRFLHGVFAVAILDLAAARSIVAIDRLGVQTLCYSQPKTGGLVFASSADMVRSHPAVETSLSPQSIFDYLHTGICLSPNTIYREQRKLLPAQYVVCEAGSLRTGFYWEMPYRERSNRSLSELSAELMERLRVAVARCIAGEEHAALGAFLSGGLDSSTVAGLLSEATAKRAKTFTIGFAHDNYDETHYAEIAAKHFATEQHNRFLTPKDVADVLVDLTRAFDEPFGNSSVIPAYYCAKTAKEHGVGVMLAGDGGDEIFAGNSRYVEQLILGLYDALPKPLRTGLLEPILLGFPGLDKVPLLRRACSYVRKARLPMPERMEDGPFYADGQAGVIFDAGLLAEVDPQHLRNNLRDAYERTRSSAMLQRMLHLDLKVTLADNDLRKVGRACAMAGMPVAYPFLDDELVAFSATLPPSLLIKRFERRFFFKQAVATFLPPETLAKRKHGFGMPFSEWPRQDAPLKEIATDCLRNFKCRNYLRADFVDRLIDRDATGMATRYDAVAWDVMMFELWLRERERPPRPIA